jgi:hypothetical protein
VPPENILRYEAIVATGGRCLRVVAPEATILSEPLRSKNSNKVYDPDMVRMLGRKLLASEGAYWNFYARQEVEQLLAERMAA